MHLSRPRPPSPVKCYNLTMKKLELHSVVYQEGKYWVAQCLDVDVSSFGQSEKQALANLREAVELYKN